MSSWTWKAGLAGLATVAATAYAVAQMGPGHQHGQGGQDPQQHMMMGPMHQQMMHGGAMGGPMGPHAMMGSRLGASGQPTLAGEAAFGTIQEIVQILEADPSTDWSKVNIAALREHLIDMNEVTLRAAANERALDNGVEITVTGEGRTRDAIKRMVPAHTHQLVELGWNAKAEDIADGVRLTVTSNDPAQAMKLRALGFMGIMVQGAHHQQHHLLMAKGEFEGH